MEWPEDQPDATRALLDWACNEVAYQAITGHLTHDGVLIIDRGQQLLPTSLSGDLAVALREHGSATLDEHQGPLAPTLADVRSAVSAPMSATLG